MPDIKVQPLSELPALELDPRDVDVRGWTLLGSGGNPAGRVDDLIVDADALAVVALQIRAGTETVVLPMDAVALDRAAKTVRSLRDAREPPAVTGARPSAVAIRVKYRSTVGFVWWALALGLVALLVTWMVRTLAQ